MYGTLRLNNKDEKNVLIGDNEWSKTLGKLLLKYESYQAVMIKKLYLNIDEILVFD